jgi:hypothetical protein
MGRDLLAFNDVPSPLEAGVIGRSHCSPLACSQTTGLVFLVI